MESDMLNIHLLRTTTKLQFVCYAKYQMGHGSVAFQQSDAEKSAGCYDPHVLFVHEDEDDIEKAEQVAQDCADLVRLLNKFRIENDFITDQAKDCGR